MLEILAFIAFMVILYVYSHDDEAKYNPNAKSAIDMAVIILILAFIGVLGPIGLIVGAVIVYSRWSSR